MKRRPPKKRTAAAPAASGRPLSPRRRWVFRLLAGGVLPLLLLVVLELGLRLAGYGYAPGFLEKIRSGQTDYLVNNESFSRRFFPPQLARWPGPIRFAAQKPAATYRIFVLGESAARGEPEPPYAASRYLETLLNDRFPGIRFEVINLGITAINSHVILPIARDVAAQGQGDLWIVYMGNNEMVGPFGAATVFGTQAPPLGFVRLNLALQKTRIGQLIVALSARFHQSGNPASWGGMKMFIGNQLRAEDPRKAVVYENFSHNLADILQVGHAAGAKILLNRMAVNLKDCPPFASLTNANLSPPEQSRFSALFGAGCAAQARGEWASAIEQFAQAAQVDAHFPEVQFRWGECLRAQNNLPAAQVHFQNACDDDALPFRADTRINAAIAQAAKKFPPEQLVLFDAATALAVATLGKICGLEVFYEHVHFNFAGNFQLGRAWAEQVAQLLPPEIARRAMTNGWATAEVCGRRLGLTDWNECAVVEAVIERLQRPPAWDQAGSRERLAVWQRAAERLRARMNPATAPAAAQVYESAISQSPLDHYLYENYAEFLSSAQNYPAAAAQWRRVTELLPQDCDAFFQLGRLLNLQGQWAEAEPALRRATTLRPRLTAAWFELGNVYLSTEKFELARQAYLQTTVLEPADATYRAYLGKALAKLNRHAEAMQNYRQAIAMQADLWEAHFALGDELAALNDFAAAAEEYAAVIRLKPDSALGHLDLGVMQARLNRLPEALGNFQETLRLEPGNRQALEYIQRVQNWQNRRP